MKHPPAGRLPLVSLARRLGVAAAVAALALAASACGKKGPPLPPLVKLPAAPDPFVARRLGDVVYLQVRIPSANTDKSTPADIERVEIYGLTGRPATDEDVFRSGTLVASIPVRKPAEETRESTQERRDERGLPPAERPAPPPRPPASMEAGFDQGDTVVVTEPLGPEQFREVELKTKAKTKGSAMAGGQAAAGPAPLPRRVYVAVGLDHKGRKGAASPLVRVVLAAPASAPGAPTVTYDETSFTISWTPPPGAYPPVEAGDVLPATPIGSRAIAGGYDVYSEVPPPAGGGAAKGPAPPAPGGGMPTPLNPKPLPGPPFVDKAMAFGTRRCFTVRAVTMFGDEAIEGEASPATCVTPVDTFPPAAPGALRAVGGRGVVSLIWEGVEAPDLAGYLVLRATLPGGAFEPLTPEPIKATTFNDTTVGPGVRYAYEVVAVDAAGNRSRPSKRVEESARDGQGKEKEVRSTK